MFSRQQAITLARVCAKAKREAYYVEPFLPHDWVIDAICEASKPSLEEQRTAERLMWLLPIVCGEESERTTERTVTIGSCTYARTRWHCRG